MEKFIKDTNLQPDVVEFDYDPVINMFTSGEVAIVTGTSRWANDFRNQGMDVMFLPYFAQDAEQWLLTTPQWQVALNKNLEKDKARQEKAMRVLRVMLSNGAQALLSNGREQLPYSQNVDLSIAEPFANLTPVAQSNQMYIRIVSNDFFSASRDVVQKMITGEYNAQKAYEAFDAQLREPKDVSAEVVLTSENTYSNVFYGKGGNEAYSVMSDRTKDKWINQVLEEAVHSAQSANRARSTFLSNMSHDIRTPTNAIKFTPAGGTVSVRVSQLPGAPEGKGLYEIRVKDTGIGMSEEFAEKTLNPLNGSVPPPQCNSL